MRKNFSKLWSVFQDTCSPGCLIVFLHSGWDSMEDHLKPLLRGLNGIRGLYKPFELQYTPMSIACNIVETLKGPLIYKFHEIKHLKAQ